MCGIPGITPRIRSSSDGLVADVIATESPSQESPVVIHTTWAVIASFSCCPGTNSTVAISAPLDDSTDPRQRIADQQIHHPPAAEGGLDEHHSLRLRPHFADRRGLLAAGHASQRS